jgi:hypothetical protein
MRGTEWQKKSEWKNLRDVKGVFPLAEGRCEKIEIQVRLRLPSPPSLWSCEKFPSWVRCAEGFLPNFFHTAQQQEFYEETMEDFSVSMECLTAP